MSAEPISMQEWLCHATPNHPLRLIRDEAQQIFAEAERFVASIDDWMTGHFEATNEAHQYDQDDEDWAA